MELHIDEKNVTILIADDEPTNRLIAKTALKKEGYKLIEATNGYEAVELTKKHHPDVILMDAIMPEIDGFEAIKQIKKIHELQNIPILMITALDSKDNKVKAFESGANDYLNKPLDMKELVLRVRSFVKMRYLYLQNLKARIDFTYNIPNLQALRDRLETSINPAGIFLQIKEFESVVYLYGLEGSKIIVKDLLNKINKFCLIENITVYTIAEDKFVIFWDNEDYKYSMENIEKYTKKLHKTINNSSFGNKLFNNNLKFNLAINTIKDNFIQIGILILKEAMKQNKSYLVADHIYKELLNNVEKSMNMITYIDKAIQENKVVPVYQPILDAKTKTIKKYECLVRIKKDDGKLLSPFHFLDVSKQSEQYDTITKTMISKTFEFMKDKDFEFSINLSSIDIENKELLHFLFNKLSHYNFHNRLIIELLEDEIIHNFDEVLKFIKHMKKLGVRIAIDDYGSGYSNLERIFQFEPDFIKIDGSIIKGICEDHKKLAIAKSAVYLAKEIGVKTVAEFVYTKEIYDKCLEIDIDFLQGYYIDEPRELD